MKSTHQDWMEKALEEAKKALPSDVPVGALVLNNEGKLLSSAFNIREAKNSPIGHAEIIAIEKAASKLNNWRLDGCNLYVTLEPCPMCASAVIQARISKVVFGAYDLKEGALGSKYNLQHGSQLQVIGGIMEQECSNLLKDFFKNKR